MLTILGLGPGDGRYLTREALELLEESQEIYLRTARHPAAADLPAHLAFHSFDHLYEAAEAFDAIYTEIVAAVLALAAERDIVYAVPGHPFMGEATVIELTARAREAGIPLRTVAGLSYVEPCLAAVGQDGMEGVQLFDALDLVTQNYPQLSPDRPVLVGQVYNRLLAGELKLGLTAVYPDDHPVALIHAAGTAEERVEHLPLYAIDQGEAIAHLTSLFIYPLPRKSDMAALAEVVATLRGPNGCPWDQEQTPLSLREGFLEEVYEVLEALEKEDSDHLREELGDVLLHVAMQAQMAAEEGVFSLSEVIAGIVEKLIRRHPHVWGGVDLADSQAVVASWEAIKAAEKGKADGPVSMLDGIGMGLPALMVSQKIQKRASKAGFDWQNIRGVYDKLREEIIELQAAETDEERQAELGDLLFTVVNLANWLGIPAESALRDANAKFSRRFRLVEELISSRGQRFSDLDEAALDRHWREAKRRLSGA